MSGVSLIRNNLFNLKENGGFRQFYLNYISKEIFVFFCSEIIKNYQVQQHKLVLSQKWVDIYLWLLEVEIMVFFLGGKH